MSAIYPVWISLLPRLALWLVWLVAVVLAIRGWSRHPRASLLAVIAVAIFFLDSLLGLGGTFFLNRFIENSRLGGARISAILGMFGAVQLLINVVGWGFAVAAMFADRRG